MNRSTELALLALASRHGDRHVRLQAHEAEPRSRPAIERLGPRFAEDRPQDRGRADGTVAGAAVCAVLAEDRPEVERGSAGVWPPGATGRSSSAPGRP